MLHCAVLCCDPCRALGKGSSNTMKAAGLKLAAAVVEGLPQTDRNMLAVQAEAWKLFEKQAKVCTHAAIQKACEGLPSVVVAATPVSMACMLHTVEQQSSSGGSRSLLGLCKETCVGISVYVLPCRIRPQMSYGAQQQACLHPSAKQAVLCCGVLQGIMQKKPSRSRLRLWRMQHR